MTKRDIIRIIKTNFNLNIDRDDDDAIIETVAKGAELQGANLWLLIFAIIIASVGLNVNSTAVVIGAMLISPLMGPLIAIGLGLSINDFDMIKFAIKNLSFALVVALVTSTLYFLLTPLDQAQTEILARTTPTIFDVFIAFSGGLAGMVATTRKVKGNVIPGVAIATALMPPLCTAGYGIASGNWEYFFGAFYLFFINCVFIFLGTFLIVRTMRFRPKTFLDKALEGKIRRYIYAMIAITVIPSSYLAYNMIDKSIFERRINHFLEAEVVSLGLSVIERRILSEDDGTHIVISAIGAEINDDMVKVLNEKLKFYNILNSKISFKNLQSKTDMVALKSVIIEELYRNNENIIKDKDQKIALLEKELEANRASLVPVASIRSELKIHFPNLEDIILSKVTMENKKTLLLGYIKHSGTVNTTDLQKTKEWLRVRTQSHDVKVFTEQVAKSGAQAAIK